MGWLEAEHRRMDYLMLRTIKGRTEIRVKEMKAETREMEITQDF